MNKGTCHSLSKVSTPASVTGVGRVHFFPGTDLIKDHSVPDLARVFSWVAFSTERNYKGWGRQ